MCWFGFRGLGLNFWTSGLVCLGFGFATLFPQSLRCLGPVSETLQLRVPIRLVHSSVFPSINKSRILFDSREMSRVSGPLGRALAFVALNRSQLCPTVAAWPL